MLQIVATLFLINFGADGFVWMENLDDWKSSCQAIIDKLQQEPIISGMHDNSSPNEINNLKESLRTLEAKVSKVMELIRTEPVTPPVNFYTIFNKYKQRIASPLQTTIAYCDQLQNGTDYFGQKSDQKYLDGILPKIGSIIRGLPIEFGTFIMEIRLDSVEKYYLEGCSNDEWTNDKLEKLSELIKKIVKDIEENDNSYFSVAPFERAMALLSDLPKMDAVLGETGVNTGQNVATDAETTAVQVQAKNDADKENIFLKSDENGATAADTRIRRRHSTEDVRRIRAKPLISSGKKGDVIVPKVDGKFRRRHSESNFKSLRNLLEEHNFKKDQKIRRKKRYINTNLDKKICKILAEMVLEAKEEVFAKELSAKIEAIADTPVKGNDFMALVDKFNWEWTELFDRRIDQWLKTDQEKEKHRIKMVETSMTAYEISKPLKSTIISQLEELNSQAKTEIQRLDEELHKLSRQRIQIAERAKDTLAKFSLDLQTNIGLPQRVVNAKIQPVGDMLSNGSDSGALSYYEIENVIYAAKMKVQSAFQIPESAYQWSIFVDASEQAEPSQMTADDKEIKTSEEVMNSPNTK